MRRRGGFGLVVLGVSVTLALPGAVRADGTPPAGTTAPTATTAVTTVATVTTAAVPAATTAPAAAAPPPAMLAVAPAPQSGCPPVGAIGLLPPHARPVVLAPVRQLSTAQVSYPADGSILTASGLSLDATCTDSRPTGGTAQVRGLSLFGGEVTARSATLSLSAGTGSVSGLAVDGRRVTLVPGKTIRLGDWGYLIPPDPSAASKSAFEIELASDHAGLPAGTLVFVPYARIEIAPPATTTPVTTVASPATTTSAGHDEGFGLPAQKRIHVRRHKPHRQPLTVTPPLEAGPYLFPLGGNALYGDSYGSLRTDVPGGWHHGDDLFAPLGTPVVAVADGTLNRVGWERLGGWRLWVRDRAGDEFYYAHLSGYSPLSLGGKRVHVHRGDVIGFVGNTGDAFTTMPHLHFEIHPRSLLHLRYDGAVDPTRYLQGWTRTRSVDAPAPVHPRLPRRTAWRHEAAVNFRELLAARGAAAGTAALPAGARVPRPEPRPAATPAVATRRASPLWAWVAAGAALLGAALTAGSLSVLALRRLRPGAGAPDGAAGRRPGSPPTPPRTP